MADAGFDFAFAIGIADAAREGDDAVVGEDVAIERIERRIVDIGCEDTLAEVVEVMCPISECGRGLSAARKRTIVPFTTGT